MGSWGCIWMGSSTGGAEFFFLLVAGMSRGDRAGRDGKMDRSGRGMRVVPREGGGEREW